MFDLTQFQTENHLHFKNAALLEQALTHRSYVNEHDEAERDNERLEFLGDAVLDFVSGEMLYERFPEMPEGDLTRLRAALVRTESLAALAVKCRLGEALRMGKGEEKGGGRERPNNLCGGFEAVVGALYLDQGVEAVRVFVMPQLLERLEQVFAEQLDKDARSVLQEISQAQYNLTPAYRLVDSSGPEHEKEFTFEALIGAQVVGRGIGRSKQAASQAAAQNALERLEQGLAVVTPNDAN
ncbi:MAG TPA: ribonuclease III [Phototrophicaceae bacterium]|nr:ribonuclease III [Phototrophicaceae bacterium]